MGFLEDFFSLKGKRAALTGAGGLLVGEMARAFALAGVHVAVMDSSEDAADKVRDQIVASGGHAITVPIDVTSKDSWKSALQRVLGELGWG